MEYKLAVVNAGGFIDPTDPVVGEFRQLVAGLDEKCPDTAEEIGDFAVTANRQIRDKGISETLLETMQYVSTTLGGVATVNESCAGAFALWVTTRPS